MTLILKSQTFTLMFHFLHLRNFILGTLFTLSGPHTTRNNDFIIII